MNYDPIHDTYVSNNDQASHTASQPHPQSSPSAKPVPIAPAIPVTSQIQLPQQAGSDPAGIPPYLNNSQQNGYSHVDQQPAIYQLPYPPTTIAPTLPLPDQAVPVTTQSLTQPLTQPAIPGQVQPILPKANYNSSTILPSPASNMAYLNSSQAPTDDSDIDDEVDQARKKRKILASNKSKHLKKAEGEPFWRRDIQYDFLNFLFNDTHAAFTNTFPASDLPGVNNSEKLTFSELYIRTLAESSKCSKVLKERLLKDKDMAHGVAKVCLLVNAGRMNTTINFVPEMKSTLRTYHSIPSLQIDADGNPKQLQDTPRLKSILKAVVDDNEAKELDDILSNPSAKKPNTNLIQIIFLLTNYPHKIPFFEGIGNNFMEFFLNTNVNPQNRANRLLWLLYTYLETDFTEELMKLNPFGESLPPKVLVNENLDEDDSDGNEDGPFDIDPDYEVEYANKMQQTRAKYLLEEHNIHPVEFASNTETTQTKKKQKRPKKVSPVEPEPTVSEDFITNEAKVENLEFPVKSLNNLFENYYPDAEHVANDELNFNYQQVATNTSRSYVQEVRTASKASTASFNKKTSILGGWIYRYFKYKRSVGNKLLGMEWEDIRYDLINGVESHLYQQFGQSLFHITESNLDTLEDGIREDLSYLPRHDFDNANEKNTFILQLISYCNDWFVKSLHQQGVNSRINISFDLDNDEVIFS